MKIRQQRRKIIGTANLIDKYESKFDNSVVGKSARSKSMYVGREASIDGETFLQSDVYRKPKIQPLPLE